MINKTTLLIVAFFANTILYAQISYTDIPDSTLEAVGPLWEDEGIDFDNDGTFEISTGDGVYLNLFDPTWTFETCQLWANGTPASGWDYVESITADTTIDSNGNFITLGDGSMDGWGVGTLFPLNQDAYIAVKIDWSGVIHYGWVRVMWNGTNFIYKDYAYNTTPNEAINAGQQVLSIQDFTNTMEVSYYPNPTQDYININSKNNIKSAFLINMVGKKSSLLLYNNKASIENFPSGTYFLYVESSDHKKAIKKIIKL